MKINLTILLILLPISILVGQTKNEIQDYFWDDISLKDSDFKIPEEWKDESAVILLKNVIYGYDKEGYSLIDGMNLTYTNAIRKRMYLNDKAAINRFSEFEILKFFSFSIYYKNYSDTENYVFGVRVCKPDGSVHVVEVGEASEYEISAKKMVVPNLEIGDIIDYYICRKINLKKVGNIKAFSPVEGVLADEYHIKKLKIDYSVDNDFYFNFQSYNGAPKLEGIVTDKRKNRKYQIIEENIVKMKSNYWAYPIRYLPSYKMKVNFVINNYSKKSLIDYSSDHVKIIKEEVSRGDVLDLMKYIIKGTSRFDLIKKDLKKWVASKDYNTIEEEIEEAYYYLRYKFKTQTIEGDIFDAENSVGDLKDVKFNDPLLNMSSINDGYQFSRLMISYLNNKKIRYEIVYGIPRNKGDIKNHLLISNKEIYVKVLLNSGKELWLNYFGFNGVPDMVNPIIENTDAYALKYKFGQLTEIEDTKFPISTYQENKVKTKIDISIKDMDKVEYIGKIKSYGHSKLGDQKGLLVISDIYTEDYNRFSGLSFMERVKTSKVQMGRLKERMETYREKHEKNKNEKIQKYLESTYSLSLDSAYRFRIINTGRFSKTDPFEYEVDLSIENHWLKKSGPNYLFEIGQCIGGQVSIKEDEKERDLDIDMSYARSFDNEIDFHIPEGYTVKGIDKLNKKVTNETGGFESVAVIEDNILRITTKKYYTSNHVDKKDWSKMVEFLDAAYQFTQEKILLKKL